jgi:restriction system protein
VRQIPEEDFRTILGEKTLVEQITASRDIESQPEFALEAHLEKFIYDNWDKINWGSKLGLYKTEEQDGRQFPAGPWSIDFLAVDKGTNDLVVVELKRGKTSDATVGQILRYINWIKENVANENQHVRGVIIASEVDDALKYAVKNLDYVDIKTYKVDFRLFSFGK